MRLGRSSSRSVRQRSGRTAQLSLFLDATFFQRTLKPEACTPETTQPQLHACTAQVLRLRESESETNRHSPACLYRVPAMSFELEQAMETLLQASDLDLMEAVDGSFAALWRAACLTSPGQRPRQQARRTRAQTRQRILPGRGSQVQAVRPAHAARAEAGWVFASVLQTDSQAARQAARLDRQAKDKGSLEKGAREMVSQAARQAARLDRPAKDTASLEKGPREMVMVDRQTLCRYQAKA